MSTVEVSGNVQFLGYNPENSEWHGITHARYASEPNEAQIKWGSCADPRSVLSVGEVYELDRVVIHSWHAKVFLRDVESGRGFNSVSFEPVDA